MVSDTITDSSGFCRSPELWEQHTLLELRLLSLSSSPQVFRELMFFRTQLLISGGSWLSVVGSAVFSPAIHFPTNRVCLVRSPGRTLSKRRLCRSSKREHMRLMEPFVRNG